MYRKLFLTSILVFCFPGSPVQLTIGFVVTFFSLLIFMKSNPIADRRLADMQAWSLMALSITILCKCPTKSPSSTV